MMRWRGAAMAAVAAVLASISASAAAPAVTRPSAPAAGHATAGHATVGQPAPAAGDDYAAGQTYSILPPGENGLVTIPDLLGAELLGTRPPASNDQTAKYAGLIYGAPTLTDATLGQYYDVEAFGVPADQRTRTERPAPNIPVTIYRDKADVPHIYGKTDDATEFGAGWAAAEDRLFFMDVIRHYGEGTLSAFIGPSCADERMDHDQLLLTGYTAADRQAQVDAMATQGPQGARFGRLLQSYVAGINAYISAALTDPRLLPADYAAALQLPTAWTAGDVIAVAGVVAGRLGVGGGNELANAALVQYLDQQIGRAEEPSAFAAFRDANDPAAPTTIVDQAFPYETSGAVDPAATAMPDHPRQPLVGGPQDVTPNCDLTSPNVTALSAIRALATFPKHMSNALVVDGAHSTTGHPIAVFGPQAAYWAPEVLMEEELHGPDLRAEGAAFPGTNAVVELGRGEDYAWSATSAGTDVIDTRLEVVCDPHGGKPAPTGRWYLFNNRCVPMGHQSFVETAIPKPGGLGAPVTIDHELYYTDHGPVSGWTTAGGRPVAVVRQRSTWRHELDSGIGFLDFNTPSVTHDVTSWMHAASKIQYTFNWFYVDDRDIGYYVSGLDPVRPAGIDPSLPTWGTGGAEWTGFLPADAHPHETNPPQGFFTSWNNKPAPQFSASDAEFGYGSRYRSMSLDAALRAQLAAHHGRITRAELVQAMESAATVDYTGAQVLPALLPYAATLRLSPGARQLTALLADWLATGAHRRKAAPSDTQYQQAAAVATMDELYPRLLREIFDPLFAAGGVYNGDNLPRGYDAFPLPFADTPSSHLGSAYDGGWEGYLVSLLLQLRGAPVADAFPPAVTDHLCGGGCAAAVSRALEDTYQALVAANRTSDVHRWTLDTATSSVRQTQPQYDQITYTAIGIVGQPAMDWQNRPTFQQVAMFPGHRPRR